MFRRLGSALALVGALIACPALTAGALAAPGDFRVGSSGDAGTAAVVVVVGHFNGDAHDDLAIASNYVGTVTILLGDGTGHFTPAATSPEDVGSPAESDFVLSLAAGRFNGDANDDLAVTNETTDDVRILLGDGTGDFAPAPTGPESVGLLNPESVVVGRFDGDANDDLAVASAENPGLVAILLGNGAGDFSGAPTSPEAAGPFPRDVKVGHFNGDAIDDLVVANGVSNDLTILLGDGTGNFSPAATSPEAVGEQPMEVVVGRFNGDAFDDLAVANEGVIIPPSTEVSILFGDGSGDFTPATPLQTGVGPYALARGRFDADESDDLAVGTENDSFLTMFSGSAAGTFSAGAMIDGGVTRPGSIAVGRFNGDPLDDMVTVNRVGGLSQGTYGILLNDGPDDDSDGIPDTADACPLGAATGADVDGDGCRGTEDPDDDNDGAANGSDNCPAAANADQADVDGDRIGDACDAKDDRTPCTVPKVKPGTRLGAAKSKIRGAGCTPGKVVRKRSKTVRKNRVIKLTPKPGTVRPPKDPVQIVVSAGKPKRRT